MKLPVEQLRKIDRIIFRGDLNKVVMNANVTTNPTNHFFLLTRAPKMHSILSHLMCEILQREL